MDNRGVILCEVCGKTATGGFKLSDGRLVCGDCLCIIEALDQVRQFNTGATRDTNSNKLAYDKGLSVQVLQRYMEYLSKHRQQKDGTLRDWDNWKRGIPIPVYCESLTRHSLDSVKKYHGLPVPEDASMEDLLCAVIFNASGWLFELLVEKSNNREVSHE
jgi:hypothetical protein